MDMMQPDPGCTGAGLRCLSNQTTLCETDASAGCHDDVIDDADIHKRESVSNFPGDELVGRTGLRHTARVIVRQDARRCISPKRFLHDLTGMDARTIDRASEEVLAVDHPVPAIEIYDGEDFVLKRSEA